MPEIARLATTDPDFDARLKALTAFDTTFDQKVEDDVAAILAGVRAYWLWGHYRRKRISDANVK